MQLNVVLPTVRSRLKMPDRLNLAPPLSGATACDRNPPSIADAGGRSFRVDWALSETEIAEAQRLRYRVFACEQGAQLRTLDDCSDERDIDAFDPFCDHLLVRATAGAQQGEVIATCRVMAPVGAQRAGGLYTDTEFDLAPLRNTLPEALSRALEMGRVCVDPAWRNGLVVMGLWRELGRRMAELQLDTLIGCSSVSLDDGGDAAAGLWQLLRHTHLVEANCQVQPRKPLALRAVGDEVPAQVPALIKAYLRCGGKLLGPPAIDVAFNTADFPMWMHLGDLPARYGKRIFGNGA